MRIENLPLHVGLIPDGNRRWARARNLPVWVGHEKGAEKLEEFINWCLEAGIKQISIYVLSTENIQNRPKLEIKRIFQLLYEYFKRWERGEFKVIERFKVKVRVFGNLRLLPKKLRELIKKVIRKTSKYKERFLNLLIAYGAKFEILQAVKKLIRKVKERKRIRETDIERYLMIKEPVDLIIRTGGYHRLSNFLVWQASYAEIYVTKTLWPDFTKKELIKAIKWYSSVKRNFGK